eukprot:1038150-Pelagomonas_calceolata.AAC.2
MAGCPDKMFCLACMPSFRWQARGVGWVALAKDCQNMFQKSFNGTSHCLSRFNNTTGQLILFVWEAGKSFRAGGALGGPGQPGVNFTGRRQT